MTEITLEELDLEEDPGDARVVLRTTIRFDDGGAPPRRRAGPSVDTVVRAAFPGIVGELFPTDRSREGADGA